MQVYDYNEVAETPKLGGRFTDLVLIIAPWLKGERREDFQNNFACDMIDDGDGKYKAEFNQLKLRAGYDKKILSLVSDWKNLTFAETGKPVPCTDENKRRYLHNFADDKTNQKNSDGKYLGLFEYIDQFSGDIGNYEKNYSSTVSGGNNGTKHGAGKTKSLRPS